MEVAREPGLRSKVAVAARQEKVDPGRLLRRHPRRAHPEHRQRAVRREDRRHRVVAGHGARSSPTRSSPAKPISVTLERGGQGRDRDRADRPDVAGDRQGRAERPPRLQADRLADRHQGSRVACRRWTTNCCGRRAPPGGSARTTSPGRGANRAWCAPTARSPCATRRSARSIRDLVGMSVDVEVRGPCPGGLTTTASCGRDSTTKIGEPLPLDEDRPAATVALDGESAERQTVDDCRRDRTRRKPAPEGSAARSMCRSACASSAASTIAKRGLIRIVRTPDGRGRGRSDRQGAMAAAPICAMQRSAAGTSALSAGTCWNARSTTRSMIADRRRAARAFARNAAFRDDRRGARPRTASDEGGTSNGMSTDQSRSPGRARRRRRPAAARAAARAAAVARTVAVRRTAPVVREPVDVASVMTVAELAEQAGDDGHRDHQRADEARRSWPTSTSKSTTTPPRGVATALGWETNEDVPEVVQRAASRLREPPRRSASTIPTRGHAPAGRHDHGPRRPRQDQAARRDPLGQRGRGRGRRHHPAHRRLSGRDPGPQDHLPRHAGPRGVHGHARPRRPGDRYRGAGRGRRRRRDADDAGGDRPHQGGQRADDRGDQQDRPAGRQPGPRQAAALRNGGDAGGVGRRRAVRRGVGAREAGHRRSAGSHPAGRRRARTEGQSAQAGERRRDRGRRSTARAARGDGAGPERHAQPARRRRRGRDLGPRQGDVRRRGKRVRRAEPSMPVEILGLLEVPQAGDSFRSSRTSRRRASWPSSAHAQRRAETLQPTARSSWTESVAQIQRRRHRRAARHPEGRRAGLARRDPERACSS